MKRKTLVAVLSLAPLCLSALADNEITVWYATGTYEVNPTLHTVTITSAGTVRRGGPGVRGPPTPPWPAGGHSDEKTALGTRLRPINRRLTKQKNKNPLNFPCLTPEAQVYYQQLQDCTGVPIARWVTEEAGACGDLSRRECWVLGKRGGSVGFGDARPFVGRLTGGRQGSALSF